jgi:hypothetical protein
MQQPQEVITEQGKHALQYAYENFLSKKYTILRKSTSKPIIVYVQNQDPAKTEFRLYADHSNFILKEPSNPNLQIVYRCNHGLTHTIKTMAIVPDVLQFLRENASENITGYLSKQDAKQDENFQEKVQIAMAFYVTGRESEASFKEKELYESFRKASAENFRKYLKEKAEVAALFKDGEQDLFAKCLENPYPYANEENFTDEEIALKTIFYAAHNADMTRCRKDSRISKNLADLLKAVPETKRDEIGIKHSASMIFGKASKMSYKMRAPFLSYYSEEEKTFKNFLNKKPAELYCNHTFCHYETDVESCVTLLNNPAGYNFASEIIQPIIETTPVRIKKIDPSTLEQGKREVARLKQKNNPPPPIPERPTKTQEQEKTEQPTTETYIITAKGKEALQYAYDNFLSQKYKATGIEVRQPIIDWNQDKQEYRIFENHALYPEIPESNLKVVYRSNHGLSHAARTMALVPDVMDFLIKHASVDIRKYLEIQNEQNRDQFLEKLQITMAFLVTGRESENGFSEPQYLVKNSANNFRNYAKNHPGLFKDEKEIELFATCVDAYLEDNAVSELKKKDQTDACVDDNTVSEQKNDDQIAIFAIKAILLGAHGADMTRNNPAEIVKNETIKDLLKAVDIKDRDNPIIRHEASEILGKASKLSHKMGASFISYYDGKTLRNVPDKKHPEFHCNETFFNYETNVTSCVDFLNNSENYTFDSKELAIPRKPSSVRIVYPQKPGLDIHVPDDLSHLQTFINKLKTADFSILEGQTHHAGLEKIQAIARSTKTNRQKYKEIYEEAHYRIYGWCTGRKLLSEFQFVGDGRNPVVGHFYKRIIEIGTPGTNPKYWDVFNYLFDPNPDTDAAAKTLCHSDDIITQCFGDTKSLIILTLKEELRKDKVQQHPGLMAIQDAISKKYINKIHGKSTKIVSIFSPSVISDLWKEITNVAWYRNSIVSGVRQMSHYFFPSSNNKPEDPDILLLYRALEQYNQNIADYPQNVEDLPSLLIAQQKREAIQLLKERVTKVDSGIMKLISPKETIEKIEALKGIVKALKKPDHRSVAEILRELESNVTSGQGNLVTGNPNGLKRGRWEEDSLNTESMKLFQRLKSWTNPNEFDFLKAKGSIPIPS